jgi:N-acetylmuramoyl-L-alanine amidase
LLAPPDAAAPAFGVSPPTTHPLWPSNWVNVWIPLESWSGYNGLAKPVQVAANPHPTYELRSTNRVLTFQVGTRLALCDGLQCWLGFEPQSVKGLPYIHWLDALKNLQPLLSEALPGLPSSRSIVIDAGHGGRDSGTKSVFNGELEKHYTLDWALRLRELLLARGWKVFLTRSNDIDLPLTDRVALAERTSADLFLSLHFNSGLPRVELTGVETYCLTPPGMPSNLRRNYEDDPQQVYPNNAFDEQNYRLAFALHRELLRITGAADRGVRRARFMGVLRGQNRPAVLIEAGYLSNPQEAKRIASSAYRQTLAEAVAKALEQQ